MGTQPPGAVSGNLDQRIIRGELGERRRDLLQAIDVFDEVDSTNLALQRLPKSLQHAHAIIAGRQTAGRGRRGRAWHSPSGCNIYLSMGWRFPASTGLAPLPLAVAVAGVRAMHRAGVRGCGIKWPNDLLVAGKKLAGILVEVQRGDEREAVAVIGMGINLGMPPDSEARNAITQEWTDMTAHMADPVAPDLRSRACGWVIDELLGALCQYSESGFHPFAAEWSELDLLRGRRVRLENGQDSFEGTAMGISERGGLLIECSATPGTGPVREFVAGEVSVRLTGA